MNIEGYREGDTIAGEATPPGRGGISVIRLSGEKTHDIVSRLIEQDIPKAGEFKVGYFHHHGRPTEIIDQVIISCYKAPYSYTGEDVIELSLHGNPVLVSAMLAELYSAGARASQPGEFTFRAFINGRIDLTQAEAGSELITSTSIESADFAFQRLIGSIKDNADIISNQILKLLSVYEIELDFVEEDVSVASKEENKFAIEDILIGFNGLLTGYKQSHSMQSGVQVALVGHPNVGKSSLFNRLINQQKAITHHQPGTTRDALDSAFMINGIEFTLYDTAGIRESGEEVENVGVERALKISARCELIIEVSSVDIGSEYRYIGKSEQKVIKVINKIDFANDYNLGGKLGVSAQDGTGMGALCDAMYKFAIGSEAVSRKTVSNERQYHLMKKAQQFATNAKECIDNDSPQEIVAEELRATLSCVDEMTGKGRLDTILENIFSKFCIGK